MPADVTREILRFGPFELDTDREELKKSGLVLRLPRQPLRLLALLAQRAGETITREEIQQELWGSETYVDYEQGINTAIRHIRFHLADNAEAPRYVRTVPRRGYVFIAPVERVAAPNEPAAAIAEAPPPVRQRRPPRFSFGRRLIAAALAMVILVVMAAAAAILRPQPSGASAAGTRRLIAILPFEVIGRLPDGVDRRVFAEELRATLGWLPRRHIALVDASSARRADVLIKGTIQRVPDGIRVIVSGVDSASRTQLWSTTVDRPTARGSDLAVETAHRVLQEVADRFLPPPRHEPLLHTRASPRALELYRRGRIERARSLPDRDWDRAKSLFEQALSEEPRFAEAMSALADLWCERMLAGPVRAEAAARALSYAHRALALQPRNPEARSTLGIVALQHHYDLSAAEHGFRRAIADDPQYADAHFNLAIALTTRGRFDEALREMEEAQQLDPLAWDLHPVVPTLYLHARRYEDAVAAYQEILAVRPESQHVRWGLMSAYIAQKRWADAIDLVWLIGDLPPAERGVVPATAEGFRSVYRRIEAYLPNPRGRMPHEFMKALYYAELGDRDRAFQMLDRAVAARTPAVSYLLVDPRVDALRADPRFHALVARTNLGRPAE